MIIQDMSLVPVNTPFYWSVIKYAFDKEAAFVEAGNLLMNDILEGIIAEQASINPQLADITSPAAVRFVSVRRLVNINDEDTLLPVDREYLIERNVLMKHYEPVGGFSTFLGSFDLFYEDTKYVSKVTDRYFAPEVLLIKDINYACFTDYMRFDVDPIESIKGAAHSDIVCPSGKTYSVLTGSFLFQGIEFKEGPLYRDYGTLVYYRDINDIEPEIEYRRKIVGLMLTYYHGTTKVALEASINTIIGLPITLYEGETIVSITPGPTHTEVRTDRETYILDNTIPFNNGILLLGATLPVYTPFHSVVTIEEGVPPATFSEHLVRINPYSPVSTTVSASVYTPTLNVTGEVPLHYKYAMLRNNVGTASVPSDLDLDATPHAAGDYLRVTPDTIVLSYPIERGGDTQTYVKGDILYVAPDGTRWERYRNLIFKGDVTTLPTQTDYQLHREEYHVFHLPLSATAITYLDFDGNTATFSPGDYFVRDDFSDSFFPLDSVYTTAPPPCADQKQITFDFFTRDIDSNYDVFTTTSPEKYKLLPDRVTIKEYNTYIWEDLIKNSHLKVIIRIPTAGIHVLSDLSFIDDIMPLWALYTTEYILPITESIFPKNIIKDECAVTLL